MGRCFKALVEIKKKTHHQDVVFILASNPVMLSSFHAYRLGLVGSSKCSSTFQRGAVDNSLCLKSAGKGWWFVTGTQ